MYPERRKRNIQLISDEERKRLQKTSEVDNWGKIEDDHKDDFQDLEEGEEILLESDEEEIEVDEDEWLENEDVDEEEQTSEIEDVKVQDSLLPKITDEKLQPRESASNVFLIDGKPFIVKEQTKKPTFHESHVRVTTYIDKNVHQIIKMLLAQNQIESITKLINDSVKAYLQSEFSNDNNR